MTAATWIAIWGTSALIAGVAGGVVAARKKRDRSAWIAWGFLFPPAVLVLWLLPARESASVRRRSRDKDEKEDLEEIEDILGDR